MAEDLFYMQNGTCGNCMCWWAKGRSGYTTDISKAHVFTREEARSQHFNRKEDVPWPKSYIDSITTPHVDVQDTDFRKAKRGRRALRRKI